jgi:hypothetical protein
MAAVGKEDMKKTVADIERNMNALVVKSKHTIEDLKKGLQFEISGLHRSTVEVLRSQSMLNLLTDWNEVDCPPPADSEKLAKDAAERIASRVSSALNKWERENKIIRQPLGIDIGPCFLGTGYNTSEISYMVPTLDFSYLVLQKLTVSFKFIDHFIFNYMNDFVFSFPFVQCRRYSTGNSFCCIFSQFFRICRKRTVYFIPVDK